MKVMKTLAVLLLAVLAVTAALKAKPNKNDQRIRNSQYMSKPRVEAARGMEVEVKTLKRRVEMLEKGSAKGKMDDKTVVYLKKSIASLEENLKQMEKKAQKEKKKYKKEEKEVVSVLASQSKDIKNLNKRLGKMEKTVSEKGDDLMKGVAYLKKEVKKLQKKVDKLEGEKKKASTTVYYGQPMSERHNYQGVNSYTAPAPQSQNATNTSVTVAWKKPKKWSWFGNIISHLGKMQAAAQVNATNNATTSQNSNTQANATTSSTYVRGGNGRANWWEQRQARRNRRKQKWAAQVNATNNDTQANETTSSTYVRGGNGHASWWEQRQARRNRRKQKWGKQNVMVYNKTPGFKKTYVNVPTVKQSPVGMTKYVVTDRRPMYQKLNTIAQPSQQTPKAVTKPDYKKTYTYIPAAQQQTQQAVTKPDYKKTYTYTPVAQQQIQQAVTKPEYTKTYSYTPAAQQQTQQVEEKKETVEEEQEVKESTDKEEDKWLENAVQNGAAAMKWFKNNRKNFEVMAKKEIAQLDSQVAGVPSTDKGVTNVVSSTVNVATVAEDDDNNDDDIDNEDFDDEDLDDDDGFLGNIFQKVKNYF